jgi:hypothetical protein
MLGKVRKKLRISLSESGIRTRLEASQKVVLAKVPVGSKLSLVYRYKLPSTQLMTEMPPEQSQMIPNTSASMKSKHAQSRSIPRRADIL